VKTRDRSARRHHAARRKARVERVLAHLLAGRQGRLRSRVKGVLADTPARCSCWMCANPRRIFGETTVQERRLFATTDDES
jgi:hypothetical protein